MNIKNNAGRTSNVNPAERAKVEYDLAYKFSPKCKRMLVAIQEVPDRDLPTALDMVEYVLAGAKATNPVGRLPKMLLETCTGMKRSGFSLYNVFAGMTPLDAIAVMRELRSYVGGGMRAMELAVGEGV